MQSKSKNSWYDYPPPLLYFCLSFSFSLFFCCAIGSHCTCGAAPVQISVIMPTYDRPAQMLRAVKQILTVQTHRNVEVVIIDDSDVDVCVQYPEDFMFVLDVNIDGSWRGFVTACSARGSLRRSFFALVVQIRF